MTCSVAGHGAPPRPLKICLLTQELPPETNWGGVGVYFHNLSEALTTAGHSVVVISRTARGTPAYRRRLSGVEVWRIGMPCQRRLLTGRTLDRILQARSIRAKVEELDRDYHFDAIEAAEANLDAEMLVTHPRFRDRTVISCHGGNLQGQLAGGALDALHRWDFEWSCRREHDMVRRARTIAPVSRATRQVVLRHGADPSRVQVIYHGIDVARFYPPATKRQHGPLLVGFVGRLQEQKGIDFVWRVMEHLGADAGIRFHFKGSIHPITRRQTQARLRHFSAFAQHEPASGIEDMPEFLRSLDVLLVPSRFENFGLVYAEGMATELLVFGGRAGSGPEVITDGVTGFLVDPDGPVAPVTERLRALAADRSAFSSIRRAARQDVVQRFSVDRFLDQKVALYRSLACHARMTGTAHR